MSMVELARNFWALTGAASSVASPWHLWFERPLSFNNKPRAKSTNAMTSELVASDNS